MITRRSHLCNVTFCLPMILLDPENQEFARLLEISGWSQVHAAQQLGLHRGTISQIVNGHQRVSRTSLRLLAELTGGSINLPGERIGSRMMSEGIMPYVAEGLDAEMLRIFKQLPKDRREHAIQSLRYMLSTVPTAPVQEPKMEPSRAETGGGKSAKLADFTSEVPDDQHNDEKLPELPLVPELTGKWAKAYGPHQPPKYIPPPSGGPPPLRYATGPLPPKKTKTH